MPRPDAGASSPAEMRVERVERREREREREREKKWEGTITAGRADDVGSNRKKNVG